MLTINVTVLLAVIVFFRLPQQGWLLGGQLHREILDQVGVQEGTRRPDQLRSATRNRWRGHPRAAE